MIIMKKWNIVRITKMWHRDPKWANAIGKMIPIDLLDRGCHEPSICKKQNICKGQ